MQKLKNDVFNLEAIRLLLGLLETHHLGLTAERLGLTIATASRRLESLRQYFDNDLFVVRGRGLQPTPFALSLEEDLRKAERAIVNLTTPRVFTPQTATKNFRIASRGLFESSLNAHLLKAFAKTAPHCTLTHVCRTLTSCEDLMAGKLDFLIGLDLSIAPTLRYCPLFPIEIGILCAKNHPLNRKYQGQAPSLEDLEAYSRIEIRLTTLQRHISFDRKVLGENRTNVMGSTNEPLAALEIVAKTDFIALAPRVGSLAVQDTTDVAWLPLPTSLSTKPVAHTVLMWTEENHRDPANIWLRQLIKAWADQLQAS